MSTRTGPFGSLFELQASLPELLVKWSGGRNSNPRPLRPEETAPRSQSAAEGIEEQVLPLSD